MAKLVNDTTDQSHDAAADAASLMHHYGFDLGGETTASLLLAWQEQYPAAWIRLATIEALYQGRYKAISVEQILALWQRRSQPIYHFNHEFERLICDRLPQSLTPPSPTLQEEAFSMRSAQAMVAHLPYHHVALPHPKLEPTPLHNSEAMQALRILHDATANPLTDSTEPIAELKEPSLAQTYSYTLPSNTLRSDELPAKLAPPKQSEPLLQSRVDPIVPSELLPLAPTDNAVVDDEALQAGAIAPLDRRSDGEQPYVTNQPAAPSLPVNQGAQAQASPQAVSIARILQQLDDQEVDARAIFPDLGLLDQTLQPKLRLQLTARYQPVWLTDTSSKQPIHQFTPVPEASEFHTKLKSVAQVPEGLTDGASCEPPSKGEGLEG